VIFLDTSAIYALADAADPNHRIAKERFEALLEAREEILTHSYVLVESVALLQSRLGMAIALKFAREARSFTVEWVGETLHWEAVRRLEASPRRQKGPITVVDPSARGRANGREARRDDDGDLTESIAEEEQRSIAAVQPAEARRDYWNRP
jgi:predicted nucleic acid-binding protein